MRFLLQIETGHGTSPHELPDMLRAAAVKVEKFAHKATSQVMSAELADGGSFVLYNSGGNIAGTFCLLPEGASDEHILAVAQGAR